MNSLLLEIYSFWFFIGLILSTVVSYLTFKSKLKWFAPIIILVPYLLMRHFFWYELFFHLGLGGWTDLFHLIGFYLGLPFWGSKKYKIVISLLLMLMISVFIYPIPILVYFSSYWLGWIIAMAVLSITRLKLEYTIRPDKVL